MNAQAAVGFTQLYNFKADPTSAVDERSNVIVGSDGALYGMTTSGGSANSGTVFKLNVDGTGFTVIHSFLNDGADGWNPYGGLVQNASDGMLYGMTYFGGTFTTGTIFKVATDGSAYSVLHSFNSTIDGSQPAGGQLIVGLDGALYGTATYGGTSSSGTVFKLNTDGSAFTVLHPFDFTTGSNPLGGVVQGNDGTLYGTTSSGGASNNGTVFKLNANGTGFALLQSFNTASVTGSYLSNGLTLDKSGTTLYGMTTNGGANNLGTIFSIGVNGTGFTVLRSLAFSDGVAPAGNGLIQGLDGALYGAANSGGPGSYGTVFRMTTDGGVFTVLHGFSTAGSPDASLAQAADGTLFGTTEQGGSTQNGTVFKVLPDGSGFSLIYSFSNGVLSDASNPRCSLLLANDGWLYGTSPSGGTDDKGALFKIKTDGTGYVNLHVFLYPGGDAFNPYSPLIQGNDGAIYGTSSGGGVQFAGTVFKINTDGSGYTILHSFNFATEGFDPINCGVIQGTDGELYGTTSSGGANARGTIYTMHTDGTGFHLLYSFLNNGVDGTTPYASLFQGSNSVLYGTTVQGGGTNVGTIFKINTDGSGYAVLHAFTAGNDGGFPEASVVELNGVLYGTTFGNTIFKIHLDGSGYSVVHNFSSFATGLNPEFGALVADGALYGTTYQGGTYGVGTVFRLNADGSAFTVLHSFNPAAGEGKSPWNGLVQSSDGTLYGDTNLGGANQLGQIYSISGVRTPDHFVFNLNSAQTNAAAFTGTNTLTARDVYGNIAAFDASSNPVTILDNAPLTGTVSGLGTLSNNVLNRATDFVKGVADLTALGMTYTGNTATGTFTASSTTGNVTGTSGSVTISLQGQTINFGTLSDQTYGVAPFDLTATASSGLPVSYTVTNGPASVNNNTLTITGAGSVTVQATQAGNSIFSAATPVSRSFTVNPAALSITANNATKVFNTVNPTFSATYLGFVNGESPADLTGTLTLNTTALTSSNAGVYPIVPGGLSSANYAIAFNAGTLTITRATPAISWAAPAPIVAGTALDTTQLNASANVPGTFVYTPSGGTVLNVIGNQSLKADFTPQDATNYSAVSATVTITVTNAPPVILSQPLAMPNPVTVGQSVTLTATATDADNDTQTVTWDFGDATFGIGNSTTHTYATVGIFTAKVTVTDAHGATTSGSVDVVVQAAQIGGGIIPPDTFLDSNGSGIPDEMQSAAASVGMTSASSVNALKSVKLTIKLNFGKTGIDSITLISLLDSKGADKPVVVDVGGVVKSFKLDSKGTAKDKNNSFTLTKTGKFTAKFTKGSFATLLASSGLTNTTVKNKVANVRVGVLYNNIMWVANQPQKYTATQGKMGSTK